MRLTTMVRLVIEKMLQDVCEALLLRLSSGGLVSVQMIESLVIIFGNNGLDALILKNASACKFNQTVLNDSAQAIRMFALAGKPAQPYPVGREQMIEGTVEATKEDSDGPPIGFVRQFHSGSIQTSIGPAIIGGQLTKHDFCHRYSPISAANSSL